MRPNKLLWMFLFVAMLTACRSAEETWFDGFAEKAEANGPGVDIEAVKLRYDTTAIYSLTYRVKIKKGGSPGIETPPLVTADMMYRTDSLFYLKADGRSIYPAACQFVATGRPNELQYLIEFDLPKMKEYAAVQLLVQDEKERPPFYLQIR